MSLQRPNPVVASEQVHSLLDSLHAASLAQEESEEVSSFWKRQALAHQGEVSASAPSAWGHADDELMRDKFIALESDKCQFVYLLARAIGATNIVEAGTSFGVSTIYLALAVGQNVSSSAAKEGVEKKKGGGRVIGTEKEPTKAERAREHWRRAGEEEVGEWITLLEGDLRETIPAELERNGQEVDLVLIDIWAPMALPALKAVQPHLRHGAIVIVDNTQKGERRYADFLAYILNQENGFQTMVTPFAGGLEMAVYLPK